MARPDSNPKADLQREDRRLDAVDVLVEHPPQGDRAEEGGHRAIGGLGAAAIPGPARLDLAGQVLAVVRLEVVEGPFDDDPTEFAEQLLQAGLEAMAGLGRGIGPAERDDEATELGDHRDQAGGQREQGGGEVRCRQESGGRSMVHRGGLSWESDRGQQACRPITAKESRLHFKLPRVGWSGNSSRFQDQNQAIPLDFLGIGAIAPFQDIKKELEDIKKDVTPPVIIKPDVSPAPAAEPRKTG